MKPTSPPAAENRQNDASPDAPTQALAHAELSSLKQLAQQQADRVLSKIPLLGPVAWLMLQQSTGRHTLLGELEWRVMPPLMLDQAKFYLNGAAPVAYASWAMLDNSAAERYRRAPHQLTAKDWNSGNQIWLIDVLTPFGGASDVLQDLRTKVFPGREVHQLLPLETGAPKVMTWPGSH